MNIKESYIEVNKISLQEYFKNIRTKEERNIGIISAIKNGYKQSELAKFLNITASAISKIYKS